jgi:hypothetical protein
MDQFEYVMVLVSIVVGLGITHILLGIGGIIDRLSRKDDSLEISLAHAFWLGHCFLWLVMFWWWEYDRSMSLADWTMGLYLFLIFYAVTIFLLQAVLVPRTWDGITSLKEYFLERRVWFYSLLATATILDIGDSYLMGGFQYILDTGYVGMGITVATFPVVIIGIKTANMRTHNIMATIFLGWQMLIGFGHLQTLSP